MDWIEPAPVPAYTLLPDLHLLVARKLVQLGMRSPESARAFLDPGAYPPTPSAFLPGLASVADRLEMAIHKHEPICIWGDFDVDGQTSTTILFQTLQEINAEVIYHIPIREVEGHGVNIPRLKDILDHGIKLILTCDTGITAHTAVEYALGRGVEMLITDHHDLPELLPPATAIANPKLLPAGHPLATLSGAGVAYKLAEELYRRFGREEEAITQIDLAALGLVADLAQLTGDARYLVQRGLEALRKPQRPGLQIMMEMAELVPGTLNEEHIGFVLGPRLNALGRLADANPAVELLTSNDPIRVRVLAAQLEGLNAQRQLLCNQVTRAAEAQLRADPTLLAQPVLVLGHPAWPGGVIGIVASRLVERYRKPAILFTVPAKGTARGSARSIEGLNITAAIAAQKDLLDNFGGHPMAAGLSLEAEKLPEFSKRLAKTVSEMMEGVEKEDNLAIDAWLTLPEITLDLANALERLAPYGPGNEKLTLAAHGVKIQSIAAIGRNQEHLKLHVEDETGHGQTILWWNGAEEKDNLPGERFDLAFNLRATDWRGLAQIQLEYVDSRIPDTDKVEIKSVKIEVLDFRNAKEPVQILEDIRRQPSIVLWAEREEKKNIDGKDRNELEPAQALAIWSTPPSPEEFLAGLEKVQPQTIYLFAVTQPVKSAETFLERLTGLLKFGINRRDGEVTYSMLGSATGQRTATVRKGVEWLEAQGKIVIKTEEGDGFTVGIGDMRKDLSRATQLWEEIRTLLAETAAYQTYFTEAEKDSLFQ